MLKQPQQSIVPSFNVRNGALITLFKFYLDVGLQCTKIHRFVQNSPRNVFNNFNRTVVDTRRAGDENPLNGVVAERMKVLGKSFYKYQIIARSKHTMTKYLANEKFHKAIKNQFVQ